MINETEKGFQGEYRFLSNFWPVNVLFENIIYPSTEHAYQAAKTLDKGKRYEISKLEKAGDAKRLGKAIPMRPEWDHIRVPVMKELLIEKFKRPDLAELLLATGDMKLVEYNGWGDRFWGVCRGEGTNMLGQLLMEVREELRQ